MESITKCRKAKVIVCGGTHIETVRMRVNPLMTAEQREFVLQIIVGFGFVSIMMLPDIIESLPWPF